LNERHPYPQARWRCSVTADVRLIGTPCRSGCPSPAQADAVG